MPRLSLRHPHSSKPFRPIQLGQSLGRGEIRDRLRQVGVGPAAAPERVPDPRQHLPEVERVGPVQQWGGGLAELQHDEAPPRAQDPGHLAQPRLQIGQVPDPESDGQGVEAAVGEGEPEGVPLEQQAASVESPFPELRAREGQHRVGEIAADDALRPRVAGERHAEVARPAAEVEDPVRSPPGVGPWRRSASRRDPGWRRGGGSAGRTGRRWRRTSPGPSSAPDRSSRS